MDHGGSHANVATDIAISTQTTCGHFERLGGDVLVMRLHTRFDWALLGTLADEIRFDAKVVILLVLMLVDKKHNSSQK